MPRKLQGFELKTPYLHPDPVDPVGVSPQPQFLQAIVLGLLP
jgi:hypothetical protein